MIGKKHSLEGEQSVLQPKVKKLKPFKNVPLEILHRVFSFLPPKELACASQCCVDWNVIGNDFSFWRCFVVNRYAREIVDKLTPLVLEESFTWKEIFHFLSHSLLRFFDAVREALDTDEERTYYGDFCFTLEHGEIMVEKKGSPFVLPGGKGKRLTHIGVEGNFVFALAQDRWIKMWDFMSLQA